MDTLMLFVTVLSLVIAAVMTSVALRVVRQERRRSEARLAALTHLSEEPLHEWKGPAETRHQRSGRSDLPLRTVPISSTEGAHDLFSAREEPSPWPRRLLAVGTIVAIVLAFAGAIAIRSNPQSTVVPASPADKPAAATPLELVSLRHEQTSAGLVVTGLVQNPAGTRPAPRVAATVFAFAADGTFLASGRAPIEFATLDPGDQSPFVVSVATTSAVARYRVGFRGEDGRVLAHIDKRGPESVARR